MDRSRARLYFPFAAALVALAGCTAQRGEILDAGPAGHADAAFISVPEDEYFWIAPPAAGPHAVQPAELQIPRAGLWVREGWFQVEFQCYSPRAVNAAPDDYPILPE